ncbi:hypothetical protein KTH_47130 [Thermosporothrix hazakensis]|nr:hypothetical protein KTH_47130 [Thermosporothrix hazakensis]
MLVRIEEAAHGRKRCTILVGVQRLCSARSQKQRSKYQAGCVKAVSGVQGAAL